MKEKKDKVELCFSSMFKLAFINLIQLLFVSLIAVFVIYLSLRNEKVRIDYHTLDSIVEQKFNEKEFAKPTKPDSVKNKKK